jgi:hypothetical protein
MKRFIILFSIALLTSGCTYGKPDWKHGTAFYFLEDEKQANQTWNIELRVFKNLEKNDPNLNVIKVKYLGDHDTPPRKIKYQITDTNNSGTINLSGDSGETTFIDKGIVDLIEKRRNKDGIVDQALKVEITWGNKVEILKVPPNEGIKVDARTKTEKVRSFFTSFF